MNQNKPVYICSPLSAPTEQEMGRNMYAAREYAREVGSELRCKVFATHAWLPELLDDMVPAERKLALQFGLKVLKLCGALIICHPTITKGMAKEIDIAKQLGLDIFVRPSPNQYYTAERIPEMGATADWRAWGY